MAGGGFALSKQILVNNRDIIKEQQTRDLYNLKLAEYAGQQQDKNKFAAHPFANNVSQRYRDVLQTAINEANTWWKDNYKESKNNPDIAIEWEGRKQGIKTLTADLNTASASLKTLEDFVNTGEISEWDTHLNKGQDGSYEWERQAGMDVSNTPIQYVNGQYMVPSMDGMGNVVYNSVSETDGFDFSEAKILKKLADVDAGAVLAAKIYGVIAFENEEITPASKTNGIGLARNLLSKQTDGKSKGNANDIKRTELEAEWLVSGESGAAPEDSSIWSESDEESFLDWASNELFNDSRTYFKIPVDRESASDKKKKLVVGKAYALSSDSQFTERVVGLDYTGETFQGGRPQYYGETTSIIEKIPFGNKNTFSYSNQDWDSIEIVKSKEGEWFVNAFNEGSAFDDLGKRVGYTQRTLVPLSDPSVQTQLGINMIDGNPEGYEVDYSNISETPTLIDDYSAF